MVAAAAMGVGFVVWKYLGVRLGKTLAQHIRWIQHDARNPDLFACRDDEKLRLMLRVA